MPDPDAQTQTQIRNIEASTGRSMDDWIALVGVSGKAKHGEIAVTHPHPEIGGAFEIREQDREGSLHRFSLRHCPTSLNRSR